MKKIWIVGTLLLLVCLKSISVSALSMRGDVLWNDEPMNFQFIVDGYHYALVIEHQQNPTVRVLADMETGQLLIIDDILRQYASVESKQVIAVTALLSLGKILGVDDSWLQGGAVNFYQTGEKRLYEPFGECLQLRVNETATGMYWSMQPEALLNNFIAPFLQKLTHDGIRFPFWESIMKMKGFVIANEKDQKTIYRLIEIGNITLDWEKETQYGDYESREWVDFLAPFKVEG